MQIHIEGYSTLMRQNLSEVGDRQVRRVDTCFDYLYLVVILFSKECDMASVH